MLDRSQCSISALIYTSFFQRPTTSKQNCLTLVRFLIFMTFGITDLLQKIHPSTRKRIPCISRTAREQFKRVISSLIRTTMHNDSIILKETPGLRKVSPYWYPYTTMAKMRWLGREILEVVSTEFRDRSMEYYVCYYILLLCPQDNVVIEVCVGIWCDHYQRENCEARHSDS